MTLFKINSIGIFRLQKVVSLSVLFFILFTNYAFALEKNVTDTIANTFSFSKEQMVSMLKSGVVKIETNQFGTTTTIIDFDIDFNNFKLIPKNGVTKKIETPFNQIAHGTGFFVNKNGVIVTNSHVISLDSEIKSVIFKAWVDEITKNNSNMSVEEFTAFNTKVSTKEGSERFVALMAEAKDKFFNNITIVSSTTIFIPYLKSEKEGLFKGDFAKIIKVNRDYQRDGEDLALIKIDKENPVSLQLAPEEESASVGQNIYILGFPSSADVSTPGSESFLELTFTTGVISSFKYQISKNFKLLQVDAKASTGSSGSPIINQKGQVIGVVSTVSGQDFKGDGFVFAVPIEEVYLFLKEENIVPSSDLQNIKFLNEDGDILSSSDFLVTKNLDSTSSSGFFTNTLVLFFLVLIIYLFRKMKIDEGKIINLEKQVKLINEQDEADNSVTGVAVSPSDIDSDEFIFNYIKEYSGLNLPENSIVLVLREKGYSDSQILEGFKKFKHSSSPKDF
jgi:S1-C subfamily serine protease